MNSAACRRLRRLTAIVLLLWFPLLLATVNARSGLLRPLDADINSWDGVDIVCPTHCTCQRAHLRDLSIARWTGGADAARTADAWHLADIQPAHNHNEVTACQKRERPASATVILRKHIACVFLFAIRSPTRRKATAIMMATATMATTMAMRPRIRNSSRPCACCPITATGKMCCYRCRRTCRPSCCCTTMARIRTSPVSWWWHNNCYEIAVAYPSSHLHHAGWFVYPAHFVYCVLHPFAYLNGNITTYLYLSLSKRSKNT